MRGHKRVFPKQIYSATHLPRKSRYRTRSSFCEAYADLSSLAAGFTDSKVGVYRLVRIAKVQRWAQVRVGDTTAKVRTFGDGL